MYDLSKVSVVLPSLDPDEKLGIVIDGLLEYGFSHIILVNDGSKPENLHYFTEAAEKHPEITLLHHEVNKGKGAALKNAFSWFLENRPEGQGVVTVDGDNQHHPEDTRNCALQMLKSGYLVLGCRDFSQPQVPARSKAGNKTTCAVFKLFVGMTISDTQTGLRAIPADILRTLVTVKGDRFEYETNMLLALKDYSIAWDEVNIRTVYIEENKSSHFRTVRDSWRIYKLILAHFFRYAGSSLISSIVDEGLFQILKQVLADGILPAAVSASLGARAVSSLLNFFLNRNLVFHAKGSFWKSFCKYYALAIPLALAQAIATHCLDLLLANAGLDFLSLASHMTVMIALYFVNFLFQQHWVFRSKENKPTNEEK